VNGCRGDWYKGDETYGDGEERHIVYQSLFVIHPILPGGLRGFAPHNQLDEKDKTLIKVQQQQHNQFA
jgi:hypothetical protein